MRTWTKIPITAALALAMTAMAPAQVLAGPGEESRPELKDRYTNEELIRIFRDDGYGAVRNLGNGVVLIKVEGISFLIVNSYGGDLLVRYGAIDPNVTVEDMNEWNMEMRGSRAYMEPDKDVVVESDLDSNGGMSVRHVTEFFNSFKSTVMSFRMFLQERDKSTSSVREEDATPCCDAT